MGDIDMSDFDVDDLLTDTTTSKKSKSKASSPSKDKKKKSKSKDKSSSSSSKKKVGARCYLVVVRCGIGCMCSSRLYGTVS